MIPEESRIAIAEFCGWKRIDPPIKQNWGESARKQEWWYVHQLLNYLEDLNAIHEAEKVLTEEQFDAYVDEIVQTIADSKPTKPIDGYYEAVKATAAQRCEALLRTIGKWK